MKNKTVRIKNDYNKLCTFLIYQLNEGVSVDKLLFDNILNYSLEFLDKNGFNFEMKNFKGRRYPKGFLVTNQTLSKTKEYYIKAKKYFLKSGINLTVGEFYELLLFIYCKNNISEEVINILNIEWGYEFELGGQE